MKNTWADDPKKIRAELQYIIDNKVSIVFVCQDAKAIKVTAKGIAKSKDEALLVLYYPDDFTDFTIQCIGYYHLEGKPMRGFQCLPVKKTDAYLGVKIPQEMFEIQRRKHKRFTAPPQSVATFTMQNRQRVLSGTITDISQEGAKIVGNFPTVILKNDILTPVSLTLFQRFKFLNETIVHIPEATVTRSAGDDETTSELALHFELPPDKLAPLAEYLNTRQIEENN